MFVLKVGFSWSGNGVVEISLRSTLVTISRNSLYRKKLESLTCIPAGDSMGVRLLLFTHLFLKSNALSQEMLAEKGF